MTRRENREHIIKLLFMRDFHDLEELDEQNDMYFETFSDVSGKDLNEVEKQAVMDRYNSIVEKLGEIDMIISKAISGWKINRIGKVELNILRLATYEIRFDETIPSKIAINEAIEITKGYLGTKSSSFVNGVLAKIYE